MVEDKLRQLDLVKLTENTRPNRTQDRAPHRGWRACRHFSQLRNLLGSIHGRLTSGNFRMSLSDWSYCVKGYHRDRSQLDFGQIAVRAAPMIRDKFKSREEALIEAALAEAKSRVAGPLEPSIKSTNPPS
jgi:hypothetical protein